MHSLLQVLAPSWALGLREEITDFLVLRLLSGGSTCIPLSSSQSWHRRHSPGQAAVCLLLGTFSCLACMDGETREGE